MAYDGGLTELNVDIVSGRAHGWSLSDFTVLIQLYSCTYMCCILSMCKFQIANVYMVEIHGFVLIIED